MTLKLFVLLLMAMIWPVTALAYGPTPITHIVIIVQENRSVDDLFQNLPGANTQSYGLNQSGQEVPLTQVPLTAGYDIVHNHKSWVSAYDNGGMDGWNSEPCQQGSCPTNAPYGYVPQTEVQEYYNLAENYTFGDEMFQSNQGPSFPAHQYLLSGTSTVSSIAFGGMANLKASENPLGPENDPGGCDSKKGTIVELIDSLGNENQSTFPCFNRNSIISLLDNSSLSWHYYQATKGSGLWHGVDALQPIWYNQMEYNEDVIYPSSQFLTDIGNGILSDVTWITPTPLESDHAGETDGTGPEWVTNVVNAIGESQFWDSTAIFVVWDDWGGWYDHVAPHVYNSYELSFRVPLIVISPYALTGHISHTQYEFGSLLKYIEETFNLPSLNTTDTRSNDLQDCFNYSQSPTPFSPFQTVHAPSYFINQPIPLKGPDEDN